MQAAAALRLALVAFSASICSGTPIFSITGPITPFVNTLTGFNVPPSAALSATLEMTVLGTVSGLSNVFQAGPDSNRFALFLAPSSSRPVAGISTMADLAAEIAAVADLPLNTRSYLAIVASSTSMSLYVNGQLVAQQISTGPSAFGALYFSSPSLPASNVTVRNFTLYNHALTQAEVLAAMGSSSAVPEPGTGGLLAAAVLWILCQAGARRIK